MRLNVPIIWPELTWPLRILRINWSPGSCSEWTHFSVKVVASGLISYSGKFSSSCRSKMATTAHRAPPCIRTSSYKGWQSFVSTTIELTQPKQMWRPSDKLANSSSTGEWTVSSHEKLSPLLWEWKKHHAGFPNAGVSRPCSWRCLLFSNSFLVDLPQHGIPCNQLIVHVISTSMFASQGLHARSYLFISFESNAQGPGRRVCTMLPMALAPGCVHEAQECIHPCSHVQA